MQNYLIIGASTGIGKVLANHLASEGHQVFGTFNKTAIDTHSTGLNYYPLNVLDEALSLDFLPESLDGIVYCPGSINLKPFHRIKPAAFLEDFNLQVVGAIKVLQALLPRLKKSEAASVVLFSTVAVQVGFPFHAQVAASKGAIEGLTRAMAAELAPSIRINAIAPSIVNTPLASRLLNTEAKVEANAQRHPLKKIGQPEDIAAMAAFLLSREAKWITGQIFAVDGGMSAVKT